MTRRMAPVAFSSNPATTVRHTGDVLRLFAAAALTRPDEVDRGIRACLSAGQPTIRDVELRRNPLGPLQGCGDWPGRWVR